MHCAWQGCTCDVMGINCACMCAWGIWAMWAWPSSTWWGLGSPWAWLKSWWGLASTWLEWACPSSTWWGLECTWAWFMSIWWGLPIPWLWVWFRSLCGLLIAWEWLISIWWGFESPWEWLSSWWGLPRACDWFIEAWLVVGGNECIPVIGGAWVIAWDWIGWLFEVVPYRGIVEYVSVPCGNVLFCCSW